MLNKIAAINNVGRFLNSAVGGDIAMARHTLIYGGNGGGKTTICSILRSLKTGDPGHVLGRQTLGSTGVPNVQLITTDGMIRFNGQAWSHPYTDLAIFDGVFIVENVHSGDVVSLEHKRNLYRVIVGNAGVNLVEAETELANMSRAKTTEISALMKSIQTHIPAGITPDTFMALPALDDIDRKIAAQDATLATLSEAAAIKARPNLVQLTPPEIPYGFSDLLTRTIENIAQDTEERVNEHFAAHGMAAAGAGWIVQGLDYAGKDCPFCGQGIDGLTLVAAYRALFGDAYKSLRAEISSMKAKLGQLLGEAVLAKLDTFAEHHRGGVEFWSKHCALDANRLIYPESLASAVHNMAAAATELIDRKVREPLEPISLNAAFETAWADYESALAAVASFNEYVQQAYAVIEDKKIEVGNTNVAAAATELARLKAIKIRHTASVASLCVDHAKTVSEKAEADRKKDEVRQRLGEYTESVVRPYETRINELLGDFAADFRLAETKHGYPGGIATSSYRIVINQTTIDVGGDTTPHHTACFKNTLSAGDRSTLAIAFFIAHLERDPDLLKKIVVFDDPFNSQDSFRRRQTIHEILGLAAKCAQVIVLSHDATFLKQIWDKCAPSERASLHLEDRHTDGSKIVIYNLEQACQGRTANDIDHLQAYFTSRVGQPVDIIRKARTVLETHLRTHYPSLFEEREWLGEMVGKIRLAGQTHPAYHLYRELDQINDYTSSYHHGEDLMNTTPDQIDTRELKSYTGRTLRIVRGVPA